MIEETLGHQEEFSEQEDHRLFFATIDRVLGEMAACFIKRNQKHTDALNALDPASEDFFNTERSETFIGFKQYWNKRDAVQLRVSLSGARVAGQ